MIGPPSVINSQHILELVTTKEMPEAVISQFTLIEFKEYSRLLKNYRQLIFMMGKSLEKNTCAREMYPCETCLGEARALAPTIIEWAFKFCRNVGMGLAAIHSPSEFAAKFNDILEDATNDMKRELTKDDAKLITPTSCSWSPSEDACLIQSRRERRINTVVGLLAPPKDVVVEPEEELEIVRPSLQS